MIYLVDANVLCEPTKLQAAPQVEAWIEINRAELVMDAVIAAEIWTGIERLPAGRKRDQLTEWFVKLAQLIPCLDWTLETAVVWGELWNDLRRRGDAVGLIDTMIAATAVRRGLTVATRNVRDFSRCGVSVVNPFDQ